MNKLLIGKFLIGNVKKLFYYFSAFFFVFHKNAPMFVYVLL